MRIWNLIILFAVTSVLSSHAEEFRVARIIDPFRNVSFQSMSRQEYTDLGKRIKAERFVSGKAHSAAQKKWQEGDMTGSYPGRSIGARNVSRLSTHTSQEKADKWLEDMLRRKNNESGDGKKKDGKSDFIRQSANSNKGGGRKNNKNQTDASAKMWEDRAKRTQEKRAARSVLEAQAYNIYIEELNTIIAEKYPDLGFALEPVEIDEKAVAAAKSCGSDGKKEEKKETKKIGTWKGGLNKDVAKKGMK